MGPIEVRPSAGYLANDRRLNILFIAMGAVLVLLGLTRGSGGLLFVGLLFGGARWVVHAMSLRVWAQRFDATGVTLKSGQVLPWGTFQRVVTVTTPGGHGVKRYELIFQGARARVFPLATENRAEVEGVIGALSRGTNPFAAPALP